MNTEKAPRTRLFDDRVYFNWGWHDGAKAVADGRPLWYMETADPDYKAGFAMGYSAALAGEFTADSTMGWCRYQELDYLPEFDTNLYPRKTRIYHPYNWLDEARTTRELMVANALAESLAADLTVIRKIKESYNRER